MYRKEPVWKGVCTHKQVLIKQQIQQNCVKTVNIFQFSIGFCQEEIAVTDGGNVAHHFREQFLG